MSNVDEERVLTELDHSTDEEKRILDVLARGLSREFPNPERVGCPDPAILRGIASHRLALAQVEPWFAHFSSCSPCFQDFTEFRKQAVSQRRRVQVWLAAAAVLLFAAGGWLWLRSRPLAQTTAIVVLDLRDRSVARGENPPDANQTPLEIRRTAKQLILDLPIGSKEGTYEVALLSNTGDEIEIPGGLRVILNATGTAELENQIVILRAAIDLSRVPPGSYLLGVRQPGLEWTRYPARVF